MSPPDLNPIPNMPPSANSQNNHLHSSSSFIASRPPHARHGSGSSSRRHSQQLSAGTEQFPSMPRRHSRPMTPAELHAELEREQEGIVNRLTRELQSLRAHSSSIASTTSAHSNISNPAASSATTVPTAAQPPTPTLPAPADPQAHTSALLTTAPSLSQPINSPRYPTSTRQHRSSSSSMSSRTQSMTSSSPAFSVPPSLGGSIGPAPIGSSQASMDRARDAFGHQPSHIPSQTVTGRSRQGSMRSAQPSPAPPLSASSSSMGRLPSAQLSSVRMEEAAAARKGLEDARMENEELIRRVKELERELRGVVGVEESRGRRADRSVVS